MFNFTRAASTLFVAVFLASCSTLGSAPPLSSTPIAGSTTTRPDLLNDYVTIRFHNKSQYAMEVTTYWSYPLFPHWIEAESSCVLGEQNWKSHIGFTYSEGQVKIRAQRYGDDCSKHGTPWEANLDFKQIQFDQERATIDSEADWGRDFNEFCGRQTHPGVQKRECAKFK